MRLLGLAASKFATPSQQLSFDELLVDRAEPAGRWRDASLAVDGVRERFGDDAIGPASTRRRRAHPAGAPGGAAMGTRSLALRLGPDHAMMWSCRSPSTNSGSSARSSNSSNKTRRSRARGYRVARSRLVLLIVGLLAAVVVTVLGLSVSFWLAFAGFLVVLAIAVALEREVRLLARERLGSLPDQRVARGRPPQPPLRGRRRVARRRPDRLTARR